MFAYQTQAAPAPVVPQPVQAPAKAITIDVTIERAQLGLSRKKKTPEVTITCVDADGDNHWPRLHLPLGKTAGEVQACEITAETLAALTGVAAQDILATINSGGDGLDRALAKLNTGTVECKLRCRPVPIDGVWQEDCRILTGNALPVVGAASAVAFFQQMKAYA